MVTIRLLYFTRRGAAERATRRSAARSEALRRAGSVRERAISYLIIPYHIDHGMSYIYIYIYIYTYYVIILYHRINYITYITVHSALHSETPCRGAGHSAPWHGKQKCTPPEAKIIRIGKNTASIPPFARVVHNNNNNNHDNM